MLTDDFNYFLPKNCVASFPVKPRDTSRLMVLSRNGTPFVHSKFFELPRFLKPGDRLVFNDTRVLPARLFVRKPTGGKCEIFFLEKVTASSWKTLVKPGVNAPQGMILHLEESPSIQLKVDEVLTGGERIITPVNNDDSMVTIEDIMSMYGHVPLPHYIDRKACVTDRDDYQTVYAAIPGAVAAPTAGLHFTEALLDRLRSMDIGISFITLHVGIGTFRPVKAARPEAHEMHEERFIISSETVDQIEKTRSNGGRIIAVGTTVVRVLEHCHATEGRLWAHTGTTKIMIRSPYTFGIIDGLITNFHLPKSTLLMLVCAFGGYKRIMAAYREAIKKSYRFFSYGDAMFITDTTL